ncbi:hypothetical protein ACHQM5_025563 [Ranunculus cassubicifolius]
MAFISSLQMLPSLTPRKHPLATSVHSANPILSTSSRSLLFTPERNQARSSHRLSAKKGTKESSPPPQEIKAEVVEVKVGEEKEKAIEIIKSGNEFSKLTAQVGSINPTVALTKGIKFLEGKWVLVFVVLNVLLFWLF